MIARLQRVLSLAVVLVCVALLLVAVLDVWTPSGGPGVKVLRTGTVPALDYEQLYRDCIADGGLALDVEGNAAYCRFP